MVSLVRINKVVDEGPSLILIQGLVEFLKLLLYGFQDLLIRCRIDFPPMFDFPFGNLGFLFSIFRIFLILQRIIALIWIFFPLVKNRLVVRVSVHF